MFRIVPVVSVVLAVLLSTCLVAEARHKNKYVVVKGLRSPYDDLLLHEENQVVGSWFPYPKVKTKDVCYPETGKRSNFAITSFKVTDFDPKDDRGVFQVKSGGVGSDHVCLHLKGQRGKGFDFDIDVWGRKKHSKGLFSGFGK